jgi:hypothetical protein
MFLELTQGEPVFLECHGTYSDASEARFPTVCLWGNSTGSLVSYFLICIS